MREQILDSIIDFKNKKENISIKIENKKLEFIASKYSSTKQEIWHLFINDEKITKTSDYLISYKCITCDSINTVSTTQFLRKIRKNKTNCYNCSILKLNDDIKNHLVDNQVVKVIKPTPSLIEIHESSIIEFNTYPEIFIDSYLSTHLNEEDYKRISKNIISIENGKYTNLENIEFWCIFKVNNQMKFSSVMYDKINNTIFKANQPILKCDKCNNNWRAKSLEQFKNCYKIFCTTCSCCNKTFKIRSMKNIDNQPIIYQSKLEVRFIEFCAINNIVVNNGPTIDYTFNNKIHRYRIDFQIKDYLIEIKDFHIWHKKQVESGKWQGKINAVDEYIKNSNYKKYFLVTPQNWNLITKELITLVNKEDIVSSSVKALEITA